MNPRPADAPEPVLLILTDISGYTRYMTANAKTLAHSQTIITELIQALVRETELPLEVAKLEGDAIFFYCRKQNGPRAWAESRQIIGAQLLEFFRRFSTRLAELARSTTCTCTACTHIDTLRLKVIVHSGEALFHRVLNFVELAGVDVIIVHRLLKNSVNASQYLLLTEAAHADLELPAHLSLVESAETYADIGRVNTFVWLPAGENAVSAAPATFGQRFGESWKLFTKLWFAPFARKPANFHNLTSSASAVGRMAFAVLTAVLTPIFLPVGAVFVCLHALKPSAKVNPAAPDHVHKADGSCCHKH